MSVFSCAILFVCNMEAGDVGLIFRTAMPAFSSAILYVCNNETNDVGLMCECVFSCAILYVKQVMLV